jgi:hypothetical protein
MSTALTASPARSRAVGGAALALAALAALGLALAACAPAPFAADGAGAAGQRSPVEQAATDARLRICESTPLRVLPPGATSGTAYLIAADCDDEGSRRVVAVVQSFESEGARDAAIRNHLISVPGRGANKGGLLTVGNHLVTFVGQRDDAVFSLLVRRLRAQGAQ